VHADEKLTAFVELEAATRSLHDVNGCEIMPDDLLHPAPRFRSVIRRPFIEDGAHSFTVESQPESVLLRKLGNLGFSILIVLRPEALQVRFVNSGMLPLAVHSTFD